MEPQEPECHPVRFSSSAFPERDRLSAWRDFFGPTMFGADVAPLPDQPYHQDIVVRRLPGISMLSANNSPVRFTRTRSMLADGRGDFGLHINAAKSVVHQRGKDVVCEPGEAILVTSAEAASMVSKDSSQFLCLHIDHSVLLKHVSNPDDQVLQRVPRDSATLRYLLAYVRFLDEAHPAGLEPLVAGSIGRHLGDLVSLLFDPAGRLADDRFGEGLRAARLVAIKRDINRLAGDPALKVGQIALLHGLTTRSVQRIFEREGTTFSEYVLTQRLDRACSMVSDEGNAKLTITDIAMRCGFGDLSYFNRCFRKRFGVSPKCFRY